MESVGTNKFIMFFLSTRSMRRKTYFFRDVTNTLGLHFTSSIRRRIRSVFALRACYSAVDPYAPSSNLVLATKSFLNSDKKLLSVSVDDYIIMLV